MKLQIMRQNTQWDDVATEHVEHVLTVVANCHHLSVEQVIAKLAKGDQLSCGTDWYEKVRDGEAAARHLAHRQAKNATTEVVCDCCGRKTMDPRTTPDGWVCCPTCYEREMND